jgi:hypothetical protein
LRKIAPCTDHRKQASAIDMNGIAVLDSPTAGVEDKKM